MKTLIIIPAYNEADNIENVVNNLIENYPQYDYVVINDGSSDETSVICKKNNYNLVDLPINLGLSGAFQTGMKYAYKNNYDCALQYDGDGQHRPEYISEMVDGLSDSSIVIGSRFKNEKKPFTPRMLGSRLISGAILITTGKIINDPTSGMRLFDRTMIKEFSSNSGYVPEPDTISFLIKSGVNINEVQVKMNERIAGESYLNFTRSIVYMSCMIVSIMFVQFFRRR